MRPVGGPGIAVVVVVATTTGATSVAHPLEIAATANATHATSFLTSRTP